jgi:1-acyl-sn-glycerol-3-phosphate acyltransferase
MENWPINKPLILVANHQNAMLDPVVICVHAPVQLHWLTRADVFKKPAVNKLLRKFNMMPVYRERDRVDDLSAINKITFEEVNKRLLGGSTMCIFPEGTHRGKKQLHSLKKGVARMAQTAYRSGVTDLCILPVGLDYEDFYNYRKKLLIKIGKPMAVDPFFKELGDDARQQQRLLQAIKTALAEVMIDIRDDQAYEDLIRLRPYSDVASNKTTLDGQFLHYQANYHRLSNDEPTRLQLFEWLHQHIQQGQEIGIKESRFQSFSFGATLAWLMLLLPAFIGILFWFPLLIITERSQRKIVKDPLFRNSIRLVFWTFGGLIWWLILLFFALLLLPNWMCGLGSAVAIYVSGILAMHWIYQNTKLRNFIRTIMVKKSHPNQFQSWLDLRTKIINALH